MKKQIINNQIITREIDGNEIPMISTNIVADVFGKKHKNVIQKVRDIMDLDSGLENETTKKVGKSIVVVSEYTDSQNKQRVEYLLNERLFTKLVMGFTGKEADKFKDELLDRFEEMEDQLQKIAEGHVDTFVETLNLTVYSIEKYLPKFLSYKNVDEVLPALITRIIGEIDKGLDKLDVLSAVIRIAKLVRTNTSEIGGREILTSYIDQAVKKRDCVLVSRQGGLTTKNNKLEKEIKRLQQKLIEEDDYQIFVQDLRLEVEYEGFSKSITEYVNYIVDNTDLDHKQVWHELYNNLLFVSNGRNFGKDNYKKLGYKSRLQYMFYEYENYSNNLLQDAYSWKRRIEAANETLSLF